MATPCFAVVGGERSSSASRIPDRLLALRAKIPQPASGRNWATANGVPRDGLRAQPLKPGADLAGAVVDSCSGNTVMTHSPVVTLGLIVSLSILQHPVWA